MLCHGIAASPYSTILKVRNITTPHFIQIPLIVFNAINSEKKKNKYNSVVSACASDRCNNRRLELLERWAQKHSELQKN